MKKLFSCIFITSIFIHHAGAQPLSQKKGFTHQDTLRGSIGPGRVWWNVLHYDITVKPDYQAKRIEGVNVIDFDVKNYPSDPLMQIDLQQPMNIDSLFLDNARLAFTRDGNAFFTTLPKGKKIKRGSLKVYFSGKPKIAALPPWDGGWIWSKDTKGRPWMSVACQGLGASVWYPCKDHQSDEPDNGATLRITIPNDLVGVGNGRFKIKIPNDDGTTTWVWEVKSPINNYNIIPYIGKYVTWHEDYMGEKGKLDCDYWVLDYDLEKAKQQFTQVKTMLHCFEFWMGPYPFYEDGYKLVEAPHLGMEHQSAVAYGNHFVNGYYAGGSTGRDLSGSGWGKDWDYIIVHESGHEWFANNITSNDIADMWVHEGITDYSETLFVDCLHGNKAGDEYTQGLRRGIRNDMPVIGPYGVNQEGSGDMYNKGNNLMHMIRTIINDDSVFRKIMRGMTETFYHKTVDSKDIENYISKKSGKDLSKVFDQYLRTTQIPVFEYQFTQNKKNADKYDLQYRWTNCIKGFTMPVKLNFAGKPIWINPTTEFKTMTVSTEERNSMPTDLAVDKNFYVTVKKM